MDNTRTMDGDAAALWARIGALEERVARRGAVRWWPVGAKGLASRDGA